MQHELVTPRFVKNLTELQESVRYSRQFEEFPPSILREFKPIIESEHAAAQDKQIVDLLMPGVAAFPQIFADSISLNEHLVVCIQAKSCSLSMQQWNLSNELFNHDFRVWMVLPPLPGVNLRKRLRKNKRHGEISELAQNIQKVEYHLPRVPLNACHNT